VAQIGTAYVEVRPDTSLFARRLGSQLNRSKADSAIAKWGKRAAVGLGAGLTVALVKAGKAGLNFNANMEQNTVAFKHFLGSTKAATKYLGQLYKLAATTPFEFQDVAAASKQLLAFGFTSKETIANLKNIGDAASGLGTGTEGINRMVLALGQMKVAGVVQGDELRQFQEAGINVYKYMEKAGLITKDDIGQIGQLHIDSAKAIKAIMDGMQRDFGGMSKAQSKTWAGQLSTMKDYAAQAFGAITKPLFDIGRTKVFPKINAELQKISKWAADGGVERAIDNWKKKLKPFGDSVRRIVGAIKEGYAGQTTNLGPFQNLPTQNRDMFSKLSGAIKGGITQAITEIDPQMLATKLLEVTLKVINTAMDPVFIAKHIVDILAAALTFSKVGFLRKIPLLGPALGKLGDFIWNFGKGFILKAFEKLGVGGVNAFTKIISKLPASVGAWILDTLARIRGLYGKFAAAGGTLGEKLGRALFSALGSVGRNAWRLAKWIADKLWEGFKSKFPQLYSIGQQLIGKARDGIASLWKRFFSVGGWLIDKLKDGLLTGIRNLGDIGGKIVNKIKSGVGKGISIPFKLFGGGAGLAVGSLGHDKGNFGAVNRLAAQYGDVITSGYRPGDPGWHGKNRARDYAGGNMMGFAKAVAARFGGSLLELIHTPLGWGIKNGRKVPLSFWGPAVNADHFDHVHVALREGGTRGGRGQSGVAPKVVWDEGKKREWWISQEGDKKKNIGWAMEALQSLTGNRLKMFSKGGTVRGKVSWFNDTETYSGIDGGAARHRGVAINPHPGTASWSSATMRRLAKSMAPVAVWLRGKKFLTRFLDIGPHQSTGRAIDFSVPLIRAMGWSTSNFPTDAIGTAKWGAAATKSAKKKKKKSKRLTLAEMRDAVLSRFAAQLADAESNDDEEDPATYADNERVLNRRITYVSKIIEKLRKKIRGLTRKLEKKHLSKKDKRTFTLQRKQAYDDLANYVGMVNSDRSTIAGFHGKTTTADTGDDQTASLLRTLLQNSQANERLLRAQMPIFNRFAGIPYAGKFHDGGMVPGPRNQESLALVRGGEWIGEPDPVSSTATVILHPGAIVNDTIDESKIEVVFDRKLQQGVRRAKSRGATIGRRAGVHG
jgi:tape measure domain-containing protein